MINIYALAFSVGRSIVAFLPLTLAPLLITNSEQLINFYKILLVYSILASIGSLGLGNFIFAIGQGSNSKFSKIKEINSYLNAVKIFISLLSLLCVLLALLIHQYKYLYYITMFPVATFVLLSSQLNLGVGNLRASFLASSTSSLIFISILITVYFFQNAPIRNVMLFYFIILNLFYYKRYKIKKIYLYFNFRQLSKLINTKKQIFNGLIVSALPPLVSLSILDYLKTHFTDSTIVLIYHLFNRILDATVSLSITYIMASGIHNIVNFEKYPKIKIIILITLILIAYFIASNFYLYYIFERLDLQLTFIEFINGIVRLMLGLLSILFIDKIPLMITAKEILLSVLVFLFLYYINVKLFVLFQLSIFSCYFLALLALSFYLKIKNII